jgi:dTDP-4-amino-4,6-dideoxygalactose transaminase
VAVARQRIHLPPHSWRSALAGAVRGDLWEGDAIGRFERAFADFAGVPDAVAVASGRAGLRFLFEALELPPGSEVICSAFGYPVVPYLAQAMGLRPSFVDCELGTLGMDPEALAKAITSETAAVIATHLYGVPCRIREIAAISEAHGAILIEDCAHCCGASVGERMAGAFGGAGYFSFETSKPINTLGGGMVTLQDAAVAQRVRELARAEPPKDLRWLARRLFRTSFEAAVTHPLLFELAVHPALRLTSRRGEGDDRFASGYRPDEISLQGKLGRYTDYQARLGLAQLDRVLQQLEERCAKARRLIDRLQGRVHFQQPAEPDARANYMLVTALFPEMKDVASQLLRHGIDTKREYMRDCGRLFGAEQVFPNAARAEREVLHLPAYPELSDARIDRVARAVEQVVGVAGAQ